MPETAGPSTFSPFSTGGDLQRKIKSQKPVDFSCFSLFCRSAFSSLLQLCRIWSWALHAPPTTGRACGWQDQQLPSSSFISTPAVSSTAATVGRSAPLSLGFLLPSTVLQPPFSFPHRLCNELLEKGCCCWPVDGGWPRRYWS